MVDVDERRSLPQGRVVVQRDDQNVLEAVPRSSTRIRWLGVSRAQVPVEQRKKKTGTIPAARRRAYGEFPRSPVHALIYESFTWRGREEREESQRAKGGE